MTAHLCPDCGRVGFTWSIDEEVSPDTRWHCSLCGYHATEDEETQFTCPTCAKDEFASVLADCSGEYRYCFSCGVKTTS